ncbi:sensor histidine kinase [Streptosporangium sp. V21-05]|uniref:sensor histidine kinase n=1 Tax=Streptosporangium sp. V21-05 TaxID=3446115 RepID=UPI003F536626
MSKPRGPARPRRTVRQRFTILYAALFLLSGLGLLALTNLLATGMSVTQPVPGQTSPVQRPDLTRAQERVHQLEARLSDVHAVQSRQLLVGSVIALVVMAATSFLLGRAMAGRVLRPLRTITAATRRISAENLHERLAAPGPADEVKDLADTIDGLLERLEASFAAQRRFVANASHELRTPLTTMRASLDVAVAKPEPVPPQTLALADRLRTELDRVDGLLEGFLDLARAQHGELHGRVPVALGALVSESLAARATDIAERDLTVEARVRDIAWTRGSPPLLSRMVNNVIDNAVVHNRHGGTIRLTTGTGIETGTGTGTGSGTRSGTGLGSGFGTRSGSGSGIGIGIGAGDDPVWLVVETDGPVLDPAQVAGLAEPFRRLAADRTGSETGAGLGLSIVAAVVGAHGGALALHARPEGGLRVTVSLPREPAPENGSHLTASPLREPAPEGGGSLPWEPWPESDSRPTVPSPPPGPAQEGVAP